VELYLLSATRFRKVVLRKAMDEFSLPVISIQYQDQEPVELYLLSATCFRTVVLRKAMFKDLSS